jgi:hypothetical protein
VLKRSGEPYTKAIVDKLVTFKVGPKCAARLGDNDGGAAHIAGFVTRDIAALAKVMTGDDWSSIESNNGDKEKNAPIVAEKIDAFRSSFSLLIEIEGDDCDNSFGALWTKYPTSIITAVNAYQNKLPKLNIAIHAKKSARTVTYTVSPDGSTVDYIVPRDIEAPDWSLILEKPFRQRLSGFTDDFAYQQMLYSDNIAARVLDRLVTLKVGPACKAKLPDKKNNALHAFSFATRDIATFALAVTGDDWSTIANQNGANNLANREIVYGMIEEFRKRFGLTIIIEGADCDATSSGIWLRHLTTLSRAMSDNPPKAKKVAIELKVVAKAKDMKVTTTKDGSKISILVPAVTEPKAWSDRIAAAFAQFPKRK